MILSAHLHETKGKNMSVQHPGFWLRFLWAFRYFFLVLVRPEFARQVAELDAKQKAGGEKSQITKAAVSETGTAEEVVVAEQIVVAEKVLATESAPETVAAPTQVDEAVKAQPVLQLLGLLQQEARLIDFLQEDVTHYGDADIGAAARVVHGGCRKVLQQYLELAPVMAEQEQSRVTIQSGYDPAEIHLTGRVSGQGPFNGVLMHKGWKVTRIQLPELTSGHNVQVLAPAEVEV